MNFMKCKPTGAAIVPIAISTKCEKMVSETLTAPVFGHCRIALRSGYARPVGCKKKTYEFERSRQTLKLAGGFWAVAGKAELFRSATWQAAEASVNERASGEIVP